ncbi:glycoside hydrolase family 20 protein [Polaribacter sargassicola]|uniref:glycoside hydrolase family 20 protein n=1 Tax=Polaribacter sargassicola TaxID=2836891 RepID=UPI001F1C1C96|nr:family 20 glycosylhydrolase [Polaribacter sp. DS7-9]MCG1037722.1 family 20 glycosylhydrolase [Polaribacter sp. DS7-9]
MKKKIYLYLLLVFVIIINACKEKSTKIFSESDITIIPKVNSLKINPGVFKFDKNTVFVTSKKEQITAASVLIDKFKNATGWALKTVEKLPTSNYILFKSDEKLLPETYTLTIKEKHINITASDNAGFLYAIQSLRQLLPIEIESKKKVEDIVWQVPNVEIKDGPRFKWRGLMLDLSRHFFDKEYIKETIDALSMHKMNILHLHLVDDQGWRIEIKKYPKLTEVGAWRVDQESTPWNSRKDNNPKEKGTYGGFLTQEDLKEIVAYASLKGVEVVPEIEMPAHVTSAIAAYPELSCLSEPVAVPSGAIWPITDIYCAGKESTFQFLENVLSEVIEIFPSKYIHIGGDEATKTNWIECLHCKKRIKEEGLKNVDELQSYFIKRMEKFINSKGKKIIGWDEILEGGLAPDATVMSWRGVKGGVEAAKHGNDAIMTPVSHSYFDYYQGPPELEPIAGGSVLSVSKVYTFDPVVEELTEQEAQHILGGQANLWAEHISTEEHSQYMIFPRLTALSETVWSTKSSRNWDDFSKRLKVMLKRYETLDINFAKSTFIIGSKATTDNQNKTIALTLYNEYKDSDIRYALNEEGLNKNSTKFDKPIILKETTSIKASLFENNLPVGNVFTDTIVFHKAVSSIIDYQTSYHERHKGSEKFNLVNTLRGSKNFRDGRWQAWLNKDVDIVIDLEAEKTIKEVVIGSMQNQKNGIFYPAKINILTSTDGKKFTEIQSLTKEFKENNQSELKDFKLEFKPHKVKFIKLKVNLLKNNKNRNEVWFFMDEILVN